MKLSELHQWYKTPPGKWILQFEQDQLSRWISRASFGQVLQVGGLAGCFDIARHDNLNYCYLSSDAVDINLQKSDVIAHPEELPFQRNSIDLLILVHVLEFTEHPTVVLKEAFDILSPYGKLILFCFNSWSYWGIHKLFADKTCYPWSGKYFSPTRLQHWALMIGYNNLKDKTLCFRAPFNKRAITRNTFIIEALGQIAFPVLGAINAFMLEKRVLGTRLEPRMLWKEKQVVNPRGLEPSTRVNKVIINE